jgi:hypothetical protein
MSHMQKEEYYKRLEKQHQAKEAASWVKVGPGRPA